MRVPIPRYESGADAQSRLQNTYLRYRGRGCFVRNVDNNQSVEVEDLATGDHFRFHASDTEFDISSPPVGYVSNGNHVVYVQRDAARRFRQGLSDDNTSVTREDILPVPPGVPVPGLRLSALRFNEIGRSINNEFDRPTFGRNHGVFRENNFGIPLSRRVAIVSSGKPGVAKIRYRCQTIGVLEPGERPTLIGVYDNEWFRNELRGLGL